MVVLVLFGSALLSSVTNLTLSRTVTQIEEGYQFSIMVDKGCSKVDEYGSNDCIFEWDKEYTVNYTGVLAEAIGKKSVIESKIRVDDFYSFSESCPLCGANCTFTIPVIKLYVDVVLPSCPLIKAGPFSHIKKFRLNDTEPPLRGSFKGSLILSDSHGQSVVTFAVSGGLS
ncbi:hypothetical protein DIPPA_19018 [Diplonema papillatum]|nr:hypothetical protein DIPPA_19018 [Diplonema papillatum]